MNITKNTVTRKVAANKLAGKQLTGKAVFGSKCPYATVEYKSNKTCNTNKRFYT